MPLKQSFQSHLLQKGMIVKPQLNAQLENCLLMSLSFSTDRRHGGHKVKRKKIPPVFHKLRLRSHRHEYEYK